jgi:archaemetzincin
MPDKKEENLDVMWIIPFGVFKGDYLEKVAKAMAEQVSVKYEIGTPLHIPRQAYDSTRKKYNSSMILNFLKDLEAPYQTVMGVTEYDIFCSKWDYVFSETDMILGVGILSFLRLRQEFYGLKPDNFRFYHRSLSEMVHVAGHLFGLRHCSDPYCVMYNTPTLVDLDRKGHRFCLRCRENL